ncbi:MAG: hypothetical protein EA370_01380 [Wenzhouxiangella sp.]|nr:MAG: hypothetical protein EA370_01380 [Wenzhouxiangella sp.]
MNIASYAYNPVGAPITIPSKVNAVTAAAGFVQGTISPATQEQEVDFCAAANFTVISETGWSIDSVVGDTRSPVLDAGDQWVAAHIIEACAVTANFVINTYSLAGSVSGLEGAGLVLSLNDEDLLPIAADGGLAFASKFDFGAAWSATVDSQPTNPSRTCVVGNGQSDGIEANVANIEVSCGSDSLSIGGIINGLSVDGPELDLNNKPLIIDETSTPTSPFALIAREL